MESKSLLPGTLDLLLLKALSLEPMHGYGIAQRLRQISGEVFRIEEGTLYPALQKLLAKGWVAGEWKQTVNNRRARYYKLTVCFHSPATQPDRKSTRLNSSHQIISYAVFCLKKKRTKTAEAPGV